MNHSERRVVAVVVGFLAGALAAIWMPDTIWGVALGSAALLGLIVCRTGPEPSHAPAFAHLDGLRRWAMRLNRPTPGRGEPRRAAAPAQHSTRAPRAAGPESSCGISLLDRERRVLWCNEASAAHFGITGGSGIGQPVDRIVRERSLAAYLRRGDFSTPLRLKPQRLGGRILSVRCLPHLDSQWLLLSLDVTEAARLDARRRDCVANALHELCTPITVLAGLIDGLRPREPGSSLRAHTLDSIEQQCRRMRRIIEDLMQLTALESTPHPPSDERVAVGALLTAVRADAVALSAGRHRVVLEADSGFDLVGAGAEIATAFGNLASNAIRYTPAGGEVRLIWRALPSAAEFVVEDTGIGIAEEHIPRLTERFYRVSRERSLETETGGTGLGLAIVKDVLDRHQAALEIRSEPGRGSRFTARFPAHRVMPAAVRSSAAPTSIAGAGEPAFLSRAQSR